MHRNHLHYPIRNSKVIGIGRRGNIHGKSGSVALPRTKLVLAAETALFAAPALRAERATAEERKSVADMIDDYNWASVDTA